MSSRPDEIGNSFLLYTGYTYLYFGEMEVLFSLYNAETKRGENDGDFGEGVCVAIKKGGSQLERTQLC